MIDGQTKTTLRALKGAPITILLVLAMCGGLAKNKDIESATGYTDKTVAKALAALSDAGLIARSAGLWVLTQGGRQFVLSGDSEPGKIPATELSTTYPQPDEKSGKIPELPQKVGNSPDFRLINNNKLIKSINSRPIIINPENLRLLESVGVQEPVRSQLAALPHVTPEYLEKMIAASQEEPDPRKRRIGLLIFRIQHAQDPPESSRYEINVPDDFFDN